MGSPKVHYQNNSSKYQKKIQTNGITIIPNQYLIKIYSGKANINVFLGGITYPQVVRLSLGMPH